jgi:hypothetical protein
MSIAWKLVPADPTAKMIDEGAQRLASFEDNSVWPDSWDPSQVAQFRILAERVIRSAIHTEPAPAGLIVAPTEPTEAMLANTVTAAGEPAILKYTRPEERSLPFLMPRYIYRAMVAALSDDGPLGPHTPPGPDNSPINPCFPTQDGESGLREAFKKALARLRWLSDYDRADELEALVSSPPGDAEGLQELSPDSPPDTGASGREDAPSSTDAYHEGMRQGLALAEVICLRQEGEFLSPEYATGQPLSSFSERFACRAVANAIKVAADHLPNDRGGGVPVDLSPSNKAKRLTS